MVCIFAFVSDSNKPSVSLFFLASPRCSCCLAGLADVCVSSPTAIPDVSKQYIFILILSICVCGGDCLLPDLTVSDCFWHLLFQIATVMENGVA